MLVTFTFGAPFEGRIYAAGNAPACFEMGNGQTQVLLRLPIGNICGTVEQVERGGERGGVEGGLWWCGGGVTP